MRGVSAAIVIAALSTSVLYSSWLAGWPGAPLAVYFAQLPLVVCGFIFGWGAAGLASLGVVGITYAVSGTVASTLFLVLEAVPAVFLVRQVQKRTVVASPAHGPAAGVTDFGAVMADVALAILMFVLVSLAFQGVTSTELTELLREQLATVSEEIGVAGAGAWRGLLLGWAAWLPGAVGASWLIMTLVNGWIGHRLARRFGSVRSSFGSLADLTLPWWWAIVAAVGLCLFLIGGEQLDLWARVILLVTAVPFLVVGLAVVHRFVRHKGWSHWPLVTFYVVLAVFSWPVAPLVVLLGVVDDVAGLRRRLGP